MSYYTKGFSLSFSLSLYLSFSLSLCPHTHTSVCVCVYVYICVYVCLYMCVFLCELVSSCVCVCVFECLCITDATAILKPVYCLFYEIFNESIYYPYWLLYTSSACKSLSVNLNEWQWNIRYVNIFRCCCCCCCCCWALVIKPTWVNSLCKQLILRNDKVMDEY